DPGRDAPKVRDTPQEGRVSYPLFTNRPVGRKKPSGCGATWLISAVRPAHNGATALVPPIVVVVPFNTMAYPLAEAASPQTSGTPRLTWPSLTLTGRVTPCWKAGTAKRSLIPPPVPHPVEPSFHTTSLLIVLPMVSRSVPPQPIIHGLDAGNWT